MRISFDLDDTLICQPPTPAEPPLPTWQRWFGSSEPLRSGAVTLMRDLIGRDHSVWIYTTSFRSPRSVRRWLRGHGVVVAGVVNQDRHDRVVGRSGPSKYPPDFGIDLHVDDLPGVAIEGARYNFATIIVAPNDRGWTQAVHAAVADRGRVSI